MEKGQEIMKLQESVAYLQTKIKNPPKVAIILGSGLGDLAEKVENPTYIPYEDIPNFPTSTAPGHAGRFVVGTLGGKDVICMQGRFHVYEGYEMSQVTLPIRCMKLLGVEYLLVSNAAGGVNYHFTGGDFMMIRDHINFMQNPLVGPNDDSFGPRFFDMQECYDKNLMALCRTVAQEEGILLKEGVYLACTGPSYETPAEVRMFRGFGADAVGMSTVPEVIVAHHSGMKTLAISCITNMAAGVTAALLDEDEVIEVAGSRGPLFQKLFIKTIEKIEV
ncbi:MAG: purine-nucleoside phosphorylase [Eubacteriales bacterium]